MSKPGPQLTILALFSFAIYLFAFVRPYSLFEWWTQPGQTIAKISNYDPVAGAAFVLANLALFSLYWLATRLVLKFRDARGWTIVILGALAFNLVMLALYPVEADDIFTYALRGRMQALHGANPFYQRPSSAEVFRNDPFYEYVGWRDFPTAYGPWWEWLAAGVARLPGDGVIANVLAFKTVMVFAYAATAALIALSLRGRAPARVLYGVTLFAWNPLVIYAAAGNGHNDSVMLFFLVLGFYFLARGNFTLAALAETAGALVKLMPALVFPVVIVAALQHITGWQARLRYLAVTGLACAALVLLSYAPFWRGPEILTDDWRAYLFTTSLPAMIQAAAQEQLDPKLAVTLVSRGALLVLALGIGWQLLALSRRRAAFQGYVSAALSILLFYLLVAGQWFQPWYTVWAIALAALLPDGVLSRGSILLTFTATFRMPGVDFLMGSRPDQLPTPLAREWLSTTATLALPWLYFVSHYRATANRS
ncbi:MAG: hypothetical protein HY782_03750 [Chloroflexi bacterium]|nr:hypothetical protein [Chloroflexota bacterium]